MPTPGSELLSAVPVVGQVAASVSDYFSNRSTNKTNLQIARETNEANYNLWKENNAYNTPEAQMARYRAAGLNPNMIYGQISSGNSSSPASAQGAVMKATKFGDLGSMNAVMSYLQNRLNQSTIRLQDTQSSKNDAESVRTRTLTLNDQKDGLLKDITYLEKLVGLYQSQNRFPYEIRSIQKDIEIKRSNLRKIDAEITNISAQTANTQAQTDYTNTRTQLAPLELAVQQMNAVTSRINALSNKERNEALNMLTQENVNSAVIQNKYLDEKEQRGLEHIMAQISNEIRKGNNLEVDNILKEMDVYWIQNFGHKPGANVQNSVVGFLDAFVRTGDLIMKKIF